MTQIYSPSEAMAALDSLPEDAQFDDTEDAVQPEAVEPSPPDEVEEGEPEEISEAEESTAEDDVEDDPDQDHVDDEAADEEEPDQPAIDPPVFLDTKGRDDFVRLPRDAQDLVQRLGTRMNSDYTRKTMEVAEQRKEYDRRLENLGEVVTEREAVMKEWSQFDWVEAAQTYSAEEYNRFRAQYEQTKGLYEGAVDQRSQAEQSKLDDHITTTVNDIQELRPELRDPKVRDEALQAVFKELGDRGVPYDRAKWVTASELSLLMDGIAYRGIQEQRGKKPVLKPKQHAKTKARPVRTSARVADTNNAGKSMKRFRGAPSTDNAMAALMDLDVD